MSDVEATSPDGRADLPEPRPDTVLDPPVPGDGFSDRGPGDEARGLVGLARAELEFSAPGMVLHDLERRLERLQVTCSGASDAVTRRYFTHEGPTEWHRRASW